jgi:hypothetical protein
MSKKISEMKAQADAELMRLKKRIDFETEVKKNSIYRDRITDAMVDTATGALMVACESGIGASCGSVFCDSCRHKKQMNMYQSYKRFVEREFGVDEDKARERLRFVSVLHSLVEVRHDTEADEARCLSQVVASVEEMKGKISNLARTAKRHGWEGLWLRGGVHIELVDYELFRFAASLGRETTKENTMKGFVDRLSGSGGGKYFVVHFHALADKGGLSDKMFKELFTDRWSMTTKQVHIQRTWSKIVFKGTEREQTLDNGLLGMARYCFNMSNGRLQFSSNWGVGSIVFKTGEKVDARKGVVGFAEEVMDRGIDDRLTVGDIRLLVEAHQAVNGASHKGLVVGIY